MYDTEENKMWSQHHRQHQLQLQLHQFMGAPINQQQLPTRLSPTLRQIDAHANRQRLDNHHPPTQQHPHHRHGGMDLPVSSNPRASRNMAEKQRRDNLNMNISTMASLVPAVAGSSRRMDKISILRLSAAFLRSYYTLGPGPNGFLSQHCNDFDLEQHIIENVVASAGFFLVVTTSGKIVYISRQVEHQLGHAQHELLGQSLYNYICPEDYDELQRGLTPDEPQPSTSSTIARIQDDSSSSSDNPTSPRSERKFTEQRRSFNIRMSQKALNKRDHGQYECLHVSGLLRLADVCLSGNGGRARHRETNVTSNDVIFVGVARLLKRRTITELSLLEATKDEYVTRHLVDGRIIFCDHRISVVAGYMAEEVSGLSAFKFMHREDVRWTMIGLRQMYDRGEGFGSSCYRLLSKTGQFIYLRTHGYLEFDKSTQSVESFVCVNTLVPEEEGIELVKEMKNRFSATISGGPVKEMIAPSGSETESILEESRWMDAKATVADPFELENAITHLISDLPSPCVSSSSMASSPLPNNQYYKAAVYSHGLPPAAIQATKIGIANHQSRPSVSDRESDDSSDLPGRRARARGRAATNADANANVDVNAALSSDDSEQPAVASVEELPPVRGQGRRTTSSRKRVSRVAESRKFLNSEKSESSSSPLPAFIRDANQVPTRPYRTDSTVSSSCEMLRVTRTDPADLVARRTPGYEQLLLVEEESEEEEEPRYSRKRSRSAGDRARSEPVASKRKASESEATRRSSPANGQVPGNRGSDAFSPTSSPVLPLTNVLDEETDLDRRPIDGPPSAADIPSVGADLTASSRLSAATIENLYQHSNPTVFSDSSVSGPGQIDDDLNEDFLEEILSSSLEADPDFITTNFEELPTVVYDEQTIGEGNEDVDQFTTSDQAVNEELRRTHFQLKKSIALRESQLNVLKRDLDNPALQAQRVNFTKLEAEHKEHKQMLKTLQQDHRNLQANVQHNIGV